MMVGLSRVSMVVGSALFAVYGHPLVLVMTIAGDGSGMALRR